MRYAVVGAGYWGENHVRVGAELRDAGAIDELVVCDVDERRVRELADTYDASWVSDAAELPSLDVDAATVATPSTTHRAIATDLLDGGVDLLVEKPLALDAENAWAIVDAAEAADRVLGVGHIFRHHPALRELKRRVDRGELGDLKYLNTSRFSFRVPRQTTGALHSLAVHDVDVFGWLLGRRPSELYCRLDSFVREGVDETATLALEYPEENGVEATGLINSSWQVPVFGKSRHLAAVGTERAAYLDYLEPGKLALHDARIVDDGGTLRARDEGKTVHEVENYEPLKREVEDFLTAVDERGTPAADGRVGAEAVELLDHAVESDRRGQTVAVDDF